MNRSALWAVLLCACSPSPSGGGAGPGSGTGTAFAGGPGTTTGSSTSSGSTGAGPGVLIEDDSDLSAIKITCPNGTTIVTGPPEIHGQSMQCLGIEPESCPETAMLPGPGSAKCADPSYDKFIGAGQCVSDFFACYAPSGGCKASDAQHFAWGNGAHLTVTMTGSELAEIDYYPAASGPPCIVAKPSAPGTPVYRFVRQ